jgi:hypothetical protein
MKTRIKTAHEEETTQQDKKRIIGVLFNYSYELEHENWKESFVYIYKEGMYIFFDTIIEMLDYLLYGDTKMNRAYMEEQEFDEYYDAHDIDGSFGEKLSWLNPKTTI